MKQEVFMLRSIALSCSFLAACGVETPEVSTTVEPSTVSLTREHVHGDLYHYSALIPVGDGPNASIRVHRLVREVAPFVPARSRQAVMMLHGDFSTFDTNFAVGLAPYLAEGGIDVWGFDRRWTIPQDPAADVSDFGTMGLAVDVADVDTALAFARAMRVIGGNGLRPITLVGFSHGGQLAYVAASVDAARPQHQVGGVVSLDYYGTLGPDAAEIKAAACENSALGYEYVAEGFVDSDNSLQIALGELAREKPDETTPFTFFGSITNREAMLVLVTQTYKFAPLAPLYHLLAPSSDGLAETTELAANTWLEHSPYHESFLESVDFDAQLCGDAPPVDAPLSRIRVPVLFIGAAGGAGSLGLYSTTQVASSDVTSFVVARGTDRAAEYGHADLLLAASAETRVWQPLAAWLRAH
jgi:pimeloyl-ACP methyl ester carboxylesterase